MKFLFPSLALMITISSHAQLKWTRMDSTFGDMPSGVHVYRTEDLIDGRANIAWYFEADLSDKNLEFTVDTTLGRRLTPDEYYAKNQNPVLVVNTTFFSFATNQNLNAVIRNGKLVSYNIHSLAGRGKDTLTWRHAFHGALGISKKRKADIAWLFTDSSMKHAYASQRPIASFKDSIASPGWNYIDRYTSYVDPATGKNRSSFTKWKMQTAVAGGPVLVQNGEIRISNEEERKFYGKATLDRHPRTGMGYTRDNKLIVLVVEGRNPGVAEGVTLPEMAKIFKDLGCVEALNLDGGGSSCMLVNGKETIRPSDKKQRPVPAVFLVRRK